MKWEYLVETTDSLNLPTRLNELGQDGWNLQTSNFIPNTMVRPGQYSNVYHLIFKRLVKGEIARQILTD